MRECILWRLRNWQLIGDKSSARTWNWRLLSLSIIIKIAFESTWVCPIEKLIRFASFFFFIILPYDRHEFFAQWIEHFMDLFSPSYDSITFNHFFLLSRSCRRHSSLFFAIYSTLKFCKHKRLFQTYIDSTQKNVELNGAKFIQQCSVESFDGFDFMTIPLYSLKIYELCDCR